MTIPADCSTGGGGGGYTPTARAVGFVLLNIAGPGAAPEDVDGQVVNLATVLAGLPVGAALTSVSIRAIVLDDTTTGADLILVTDNSGTQRNMRGKGVLEWGIDGKEQQTLDPTNVEIEAQGSAVADVTITYEV